MLCSLLWCTVNQSNTACSQLFDIVSPWCLNVSFLGSATLLMLTTAVSQVLCTLTNGMPPCLYLLPPEFSAFSLTEELFTKKKKVSLHLFRPWKIHTSGFTGCWQNRRGSDHASYLLIEKPQCLGLCLLSLQHEFSLCLSPALHFKSG